MPSAPFWALCYHTNSYSPRAKKWYYVARLIVVDGEAFELYWHHDPELRGNNAKELRKRAGETHGLVLIGGIWKSARSETTGHNIMVEG
jgi:hypothetical protein